ncbi:MAG TPA: DUF5009 domain-containing protein [Bacteroidota bacterium]|nr:DUF5009 domain-containing protein [Bacteroidota bacterium]
MTSSQPSSAGGRLVSLDVFRGATIAGMMLVNNPGDWDHIYAPFEHARWNGWTFTDLIFPFFLWIVGVAMTLSFSKRMECGADTGKLALHVLQRSVIIFAIGFFLAGFPFGLFGSHFSFSTIRIPGVLQRIAVCYLIAGLVALYTDVRKQVAVIWSLLLLYWVLIELIPVPGYGAGVLTPQGNLAWYIDSHILAGHTWSGAPAPGFDPEGIFSTLPAIATTLFGVLTGHFLRTDRSQEEKTAWMFVAGTFLTFVGLVCDNWLPINKNLWTSSYSIFMAGLALNIFAFCYWLIDVQGYKKWTRPFEIYGLNAITMFFLAGLIGRLTAIIKVSGPDGNPISLHTSYYQNFFLTLFDPMVASLMHSLAFVVFLYLLAYGMYRMKWVVKV